MESVAIFQATSAKTVALTFWVIGEAIGENFQFPYSLLSFDSIFLEKFVARVVTVELRDVDKSLQASS